MRREGMIVEEERFIDGKMVVSSFIFLFLVFALSNFVSASCSLGATPLGMGAKVKPGTTVEVTWNFYNLYGDRTTHITVSKLSGPDWNVIYEPSLHERAYDISGIIVNKTENVAVENYTTVLTIPTNSPEGWNYVEHPTMEGYIPVKSVKIYITVPEKVKLWQNYNFTFQAKGDCFMEPSTVIPAVATQMKVSITTANLEFSEKPVNEKGAGGTGTGFSIAGLGTTGSVLGILALVLLLVLVFLLGRGNRKAKQKTQASQSPQTPASSDAVPKDPLT